MNERPRKPMTRSGFCEFGPEDAHKFCTRQGCTCTCHRKPEEAGDSVQ